MSGFEAQLVVCDEGSNRARLTPRVTGPESVPCTSGFACPRCRPRASARAGPHVRQRNEYVIGWRDGMAAAQDRYFSSLNAEIVIPDYDGFGSRYPDPIK